MFKAPSVQSLWQHNLVTKIVAIPAASGQLHRIPICLMVCQLSVLHSPHTLWHTALAMTIQAGCTTARKSLGFWGQGKWNQNLQGRIYTLFKMNYFKPILLLTNLRTYHIIPFKDEAILVFL